MTKKVVRNIGLVAHDAMKKDLIEWVLWNSERLIGHNFYCTGTTGTLILEALKAKHADVDWNFNILKSGPLGGDQQMGSRIVDGVIDYLFFFTDPMTLQPHDTDVKALTRLASVENIVFCCNRSTADHIISSPLFNDNTYQRSRPDYSSYANRFKNHEVVDEIVEKVKKRLASHDEHGLHPLSEVVDDVVEDVKAANTGGTGMTRQQELTDTKIVLKHLNEDSEK